MTGIIIAVFTGWLGGYRFYKKQTKMGLIYLFTIGLFCFGWFYDIFCAVREYKKPKSGVFTFYAVGLDRNIKNIIACAVDNKSYTMPDDKIIASGNDRIYRFFFRHPEGAALVPEPDNKFDKNAIIVTMNGNKIGYIPADICQEVKRMKVVDVRCQLGGGEYKEVIGGRVFLKEAPFSAKVTLICK